MMIIIPLVYLVVIFGLTPSIAANSDFTLLIPNDGGYVCYGQILTYQCTACGGVATVWRGTAFECEDAANQISLPHFNFALTTGECTSGDIMAYGVHAANGCYTSNINITMSHNVLGKEIQCTLDDGSSQTLLNIGNSTIPTIGRPAAPTEVHVTTPGQEHLVFWWVKSPEAVDHYIVNATNCGVCPNVTILPAVNCTNIEANGRRCEFSVHSVICDSEIVSNASDLISFVLNVPMLHIISAIPYYSYSDGNLISIHSNFIESNPLEVSEGSNTFRSPATYSLTYSNSTTGIHCGSAVIESDSPSCIIYKSGIQCTHVFDISSESTCSLSTNLRLVVSARNLIGYRSLSGPDLQGANNFVRIHFNLSSLDMYCIFINHLEANYSVKVCSVEVYSSQNTGGLCDEQTGQLGIKLKGVNFSTTDTVTIALKAVSMIDHLSEELCFTAVASDSPYQVVVKGSFAIGSVKTNEVEEGLQLPLIVSISSVALLTVVGLSFGVLIVILVVSTRAKTKVIRQLESEILRVNNESVTYEQIDVARQSTHNQGTIHTSENIAYEQVKIRR